MTPYYLRFNDEDEWKQSAEAVGILSVVNVGTEEEPDIQEQWSYYTHDYACDVVGELYNNDGVYNVETGEVITPPTLMPGWHVNYKAEVLPDEFMNAVVTPTPPQRIFAGD